MELNQLRFFKTVAEYENFSEASNVVFVSQPALSKSIKNLEEELGLKLFDRIGKKIKLNEAGEVVLEHVNRILSEIDLLTENIDKLKSGNNLSIASPDLTILMFIIPELCVRMPELNINYDYKYQSNLFNLLYKHDVDIVISNEPISDEKINCIYLCSEYSGIDVAPDCKLSKYKFVDASKLGNAKIASYHTDKNTPLMLATKEYLQQNPSIEFVYHPTSESLNNYVRQVKLITINSTLAKYCGNTRPDREFILFDKKCDLEMGIYFCYRKDTENENNILLVKDFMLNYLKDYNDNMQNGCK